MVRLGSNPDVAGAFAERSASFNPGGAPFTLTSGIIGNFFRFSGSKRKIRNRSPAGRSHSPTMFADFTHAKIGGKPATQVIGYEAWLKYEYLPTVGKRGAAIIEARGQNSAASAANALVDHVRGLATPDKVHSIAVKSEGPYGFDPNVWAGMPVRSTANGFEVITSYEMDAFQGEDRRDQCRAGQRARHLEGLAGIGEACSRTC